MASQEPTSSRRRLTNHKVERVHPAQARARDEPPPPRASSNAQCAFAARESTLTLLMHESAHIRSIYNIFVAILLVLLLNTVIHDFFERGTINVGLATVVAGFGDMRRTATLWLYELALALAAYPGLQLFAAGCRHRLVRSYNACRVTWCSLWLVALVALQAALVSIPVHALARDHLAIASGAIVMCELFRFMMKIHATMSALVPRVLRSLPSAAETAQTETESMAALPALRHYVYFLFAPTLLYRDHYPRTKSIRWGLVLVHFGEVAGVIFYNSFLWERFILPYWSDYGKEPQVEAAQVVRGMFACVLPGVLSFLCGFYCVLHAWLNAFAEMLTFGDRLFYEDWWTTSHFSSFYRTWNRVVHSWLLEHVHAPLGPRAGRALSALAVFALSAAAHELILALSFGFFYPVLLVMFVASGLLCVPLTSGLGRRYPRTLNLFIWLGFFIGNGILWSLYPMEYFARKNCPSSEDDSFFVPRSWSCPVIVLKPGWRFHGPLHVFH